MWIDDEWLHGIELAARLSAGKQDKPRAGPAPEGSAQPTPEAQARQPAAAASSSADVATSLASSKSKSKKGGGSKSGGSKSKGKSKGKGSTSRKQEGASDSVRNTNRSLLPRPKLHELIALLWFIVLLCAAGQRV